MESTICKIQLAGKAEIPFNIRLNNHRKDANGNNPNVIPVSNISNNLVTTSANMGNSLLQDKLITQLTLA